MADAGARVAKRTVPPTPGVSTETEQGEANVQSTLDTHLPLHAARARKLEQDAEVESPLVTEQATKRTSTRIAAQDQARTVSKRKKMCTTSDITDHKWDKGRKCYLYKCGESWLPKSELGSQRVKDYRAADPARYNRRCKEIKTKQTPSKEVEGKNQEGARTTVVVKKPRRKREMASDQKNTGIQDLELDAAVQAAEIVDNASAALLQWFLCDDFQNMVEQKLKTLEKQEIQGLLNRALELAKTAGLSVNVKDGRVSYDLCQ